MFSFIDSLIPYLHDVALSLFAVANAIVGASLKCFSYPDRGAPSTTVSIVVVDGRSTK